jgi:hypothetical protein
LDVAYVKKRLEFLYGNGITKVEFITESELSFFYSYRTIEGNEIDIRVEKFDGRIHIRSIKNLEDIHFVEFGNYDIYSNDWIHVNYIY